MGRPEQLSPGGPVARAAVRHGATPRQVALAWPLQRSPGIPPIPGTTSVAHLEENVAAASLISAAAADGRDDRRRKLFRARCARPEPQADRPSDSPRDPAGTLTSSAGWCGG
ncbi:aldo/keto reductase [Streptomyces antimycoticus]|uniref:aldo/keto reductase n=1 Tax=Streptomyces antimycoticus TaxID=68175 RepID=UPI00352FFE20